MPAPNAVIVETVPARAAIAGNPSDGYGGAVLAVPVRAVAARVSAEPGEPFAIGDRSFASLDELQAALRARELSGLTALAAAALDACATGIGRPAPCAIRLSTTIPESVGLAGSSAVVIAVVRAVARASGLAIPPPDDLAAVALAAEVDGLGITAGLQDRLVQCHDRTMHMEFGRHEYRPVTAGRAIGMIVAYRRAAAAPSGATHGPLRARYERGDADVRAAMAALAEQARLATAALRTGDLESLGAAIDRSFDIRRSVVPLDPVQVDMIDVARAAGAAANFSGSGGSITVLAPDERVAARARSALAGIDCELLDVPLR